MLDEEISILIILPASPDPRSNGIQCFNSLVDLCRFLPGVAYTSGDCGASHYKLYHKGRYLPEMELLQNPRLLEQINLVIVPDHIDGLNCRIYDYLRCEGGEGIRYINIVLAPLYVFSDKDVRPVKTMYDERDCFIYFNRLFAPPGFNACDVYQEPSYNYLLESGHYRAELDIIDKEGPAREVLVYAGKGHFAVDSQISNQVHSIRKRLDEQSIGFKLITRTWPENKEHYIELMANSFGLIIADPFTNVIRDALMLGLPVFSTVNGIDYDVTGISNNAAAFFKLSTMRHKIRALAWERHFSLSRFNLMKQSLFFEAVRELANRRSTISRKIVIPFSSALQNASLQVAQHLRKTCVVGSLSTATHAIDDAMDAIDILENLQTSSAAINYRTIAREYLESI